MWGVRDRRPDTSADVRCGDLWNSQALLGAAVRVQTVDGMVELPVPPCTQNGDRLRMRARGMYHPRKGAKGDQLVEIK